MFKLNNLKKLFFRSEETEKPIVQLQETALEDGWIELSEKSNEPDIVVIPEKFLEDEFEILESNSSIEKEVYAYKLGVDNEIIAKKEAYRLAVPLDESPDKALAAEKRLENQGFSIKRLGTQGTQEKGIHLYALVNHNNPDAPITIVCRGTQFDASIIADLDPSAPGYETIQKDIEVIRQQIDELCLANPGSKLRITGHSLGGALSQVLTQDILSVKQQALETPESTKYHGLSAVTGVDTVVFQSAGVSKEIAKTAKVNAEAVKSLDPKFDINFVAHVKEGDFVSSTGTYLFSDIDPSIVDVTLILRNLGKPLMTLGDYLDVGFSAVTTGNPVWTAISALKKCCSRYFSNRLQAHSDLFHHDDKGDLLQSMYGIYRNSNPEDKGKIKSIFEDDMVSMIPYSKEIQAALFGTFKDLNSDEFKSMFKSVKGVITCINSAVEIALSGIKSLPKAAVTAVKNSSTVTKAVNELQEHASKASSGFLKLFDHRFRGACKPSATSCSMQQSNQNEFPSLEGRHKHSVAPIF